MLLFYLLNSISICSFCLQECSQFSTVHPVFFSFHLLLQNPSSVKRTRLTIDICFFSRWGVQAVRCLPFLGSSTEINWEVPRPRGALCPGNQLCGQWNQKWLGQVSSKGLVFTRNRSPLWIHAGPSFSFWRSLTRCCRTTESTSSTQMDDLSIFPSSLFLQTNSMTSLRLPATAALTTPMLWPIWLWDTWPCPTRSVLKIDPCDRQLDGVICLLSISFPNPSYFTMWGAVWMVCIHDRFWPMRYSSAAVFSTEQDIHPIVTVSRIHQVRNTYMRAQERIGWSYKG